MGKTRGVKLTLIVAAARGPGNCSSFKFSENILEEPCTGPMKRVRALEMKNEATAFSGFLPKSKVHLT